MHIGENIKRFRKEKGITQQQLANAIHKSKSAVEKYEYGDINISISTLQDIATALDISFESLILEEGDILNIIKAYYNLKDKPGHNLENDFEMVMQGFVKRYKK